MNDDMENPKPEEQQSPNQTSGSHPSSPNQSSSSQSSSSQTNFKHDSNKPAPNQNSLYHNVQNLKTPKKFGILQKLMAIIVLTLGFMMGLAMIDGLVNEREHYQESVIDDIKRMHTGEQQIVTPFVLIPQTITFNCTSTDKNGKKTTKVCQKTKMLNAVPTQTLWQNKVAVSNNSYKRGIYRAISYDTDMTIKTIFDFSKPAFKEQKANANNGFESKVTHWEQAKIIFAISDLRGFQGLPKLTLANKTHGFNYPDKEQYLGLSYVESVLPDVAYGKKLPIDITAKVGGISVLSTLPLGKVFTMSMLANWPHPQFFGHSLPKKVINKNSFEASWHNTYNSIANTQKLNGCMQEPSKDCHIYHHNKLRNSYAVKKSDFKSFGVAFVSATDTYTFTDRTIKYGLLLLAVIFGAFFIFEITKNLRIHPIQYSLVAAALLVFYVLLLSLSEHISFHLAYLAASIACVSLLSWYLYFVLHSLARAFLFTGILAALYSSFYFIIQSEDNSLIMGSIFMFVLLAMVMFFTRNIDWYEKT